MHPEIILYFSRHLLEYDIYSLLKAFWPKAQIRITYEVPEEVSGAESGEERDHRNDAVQHQPGV